MKLFTPLLHILWSKTRFVVSKVSIWATERMRGRYFLRITTLKVKILSPSFISPQTQRRRLYLRFYMPDASVPIQSFGNFWIKVDISLYVKVPSTCRIFSWVSHGVCEIHEIHLNFIHFEILIMSSIAGNWSKRHNKYSSLSRALLYRISEESLHHHSSRTLFESAKI